MKKTNKQTNKRHFTLFKVGGRRRIRRVKAIWFIFKVCFYLSWSTQ